MLGKSKMADPKTLDDIFTSEVDESAVSAIVGSLESQLSENSPNVRNASHSQNNSASANNHANENQNPSSQKRATDNSNSSTANPIPTSRANPVVMPAGILTSGALPASGYANAGAPRLSLTSVAALPGGQPGADAVKIVYSTAATSFNSPSSALNNTVIQQTRRKMALPNGNLVRPNLGLSNPVATTPGGMAAMRNLANVASQQQPIVISSPSGPNYALQAQLNSPKTPLVAPGRELAIDRNKKKESQNIRRENSATPPAGSIVTLAGPNLMGAGPVSKPSQGGQAVNVVTQMVSNPGGGLIPGMQIVNMAPARGPQQKTLAPRMVIAGNPVRLASNQQVIAAAGARHSSPVPGQNTITLQPGMVRGALLFKTENGQFQVLNMAPGLTPTTQSGAPNTQTTYRLQSVPGHQGGIRTLTPQQIVTSLPVSSASGVKTGQIHTVHTTAGGQHVMGTVLQHGQGGLNLVTSVPSHHSSNVVVSSQAPVIHQQHAPSPSSLQKGMPPTPPSSSPAPSATQPLSIQTSTANSQSATTPSQMSPNTAKKKCKNFLSTLIRLATDQPEQVATNVKNLIQGLIDGAIQPEDFTNQLQRELNSSPQPCLVPFLKKSLPYLRHSLMTKELTIEGVRPPAPGAVTLPPTQPPIPQMQARPLAPPTPNSVVGGLRVLGAGAVGQLGGQLGGPPLMGQQRLLTVRSAPPRMRSSPPVQQHNKSLQNFWHQVQNQRHALKEHQNAQYRPRLTSTAGGVNASKSLLVTSLASPKNPPQAPLQPPAPVSVAPPSTTLGPHTQTVTTATVTPSVPPPPTPPQSTSTSSKGGSKSGGGAAAKEREQKRNFASLSSSRDDDDINDVAAMGGVNLVEESQRILAANAEIVGTQIRSCKDENFFPTSPLQQRINSLLSEHGLEEASSEVLSLISHATQERLKTLVEKLGVIAEHRLENIKNDPRFEVTQDVKGQLKFLEELDRLEKKRHEEQEREILLRAAKSRSKLEDPEQLKLKQKAKEMQRAELEEMRQREANATALLAIGTRKRQKVEGAAPGATQAGSSPGTSVGGNAAAKSSLVRPRVKRVNMRDLLFLMEQERETVRTPFLYKSYFK